MSLGSSAQSAFEREAVARVVAEGILIVAASGNESTTAAVAPVSFPAAYPGVLAIGAVPSNLQLASFSNQGTELGAVAPGVDILSSSSEHTADVAWFRAESGPSGHWVRHVIQPAVAGPAPGQRR